MDTDLGEKRRKKEKKYICETCDYITCDKSRYKRHLTTIKHKSGINDTYLVENDTDSGEKEEYFKNKIKNYICECGKSYKYHSGYYRHLKNCKHDIKVIDIEVNDIKVNDYDREVKDVKFKDMFLEMVNQNKIMQNTICQLIPKIGNNITNNTLNQNVNINVFLNDNCKDAMSLNDFIKTIEVNIQDLNVTKKKGLANGVSSIILTHLNKLPMVQRPLWCSDKKRKKLYIKEDNWSEDKDLSKTKAAIKNISAIQVKNINKYTKENPNWMSNEKEKDDYLVIVKNVTDSVDDKTDIIIDRMIEDIHLTTDKRDKILHLLTFQTPIL
jgi:hypothetical protein